jgi:hypothetical protein
MSNGRAVTLIAISWEFKRNDCSCAYENMPLLISIRIVWRYISRICSGLHTFGAGKVSIGVRHGRDPSLEVSSLSKSRLFARLRFFICPGLFAGG